VPLVKSLATIVTRRAAARGKEGLVAQVGGEHRLGVRDRARPERARPALLLLAGTAGGRAVFRAPLGSAITAIEVLYKEDFESDALIRVISRSRRSRRSRC
jgi:CIC family chloride channel protein